MNTPTRISRRFAWWHAALVLALVTLAVFADVLFTRGQILSREALDLSHLFLGVRDFALGHELAHGRIALWNPYFFCGAPFFAGFQTAILYPPNWLYALLPVDIAVNLDIVLHVWASGMFAYAWARNRSLHPAAALLVGIVFMLGGPHFLHIYAGHLPQLCTITWTPLILLAVDALLDTVTRGARLGYALLGAFALAMQVLAGFPQFVLYLGVVTAAYVIVRLIVAAIQRRPFFGAIGGLILMLALALGLSAVQWVASFGVLDESARHHLPFAIASSYSLPPENLLLTLAPNLFGDGSATPYWGRWYFWEMMPFVGLAPLIFAGYALVIRRNTSSGSRIHLVGAGAMILALCLALGPLTPLFEWFYRFVPVADGFRGPSKFLLPALAWIAFLAGVGLDHFIANRSRKIVFQIGFAVVGLLMLITAWSIHSSGHGGLSGAWFRSISQLDFNHLRFLAPPSVEQSQSFADNAARSLGWAGATALVAAALFFFSTHRRTRHLTQIGILALSTLELILFARHFRPTFDLAHADHEKQALESIAHPLPRDDRVYYPNQSAAIRANIGTLWGNDAMVLQRYVDLAAALNGFDRFEDPTRSPFMQVSPPQRLLRFGAIVNEREGQISAYPVPTPPLPRALLMPAWQITSDRITAGRMLRQPDFPLTTLALLESDPDLPMPATRPANAGSVTITDLSTDSIEITATTSAPSVLVLTDNYAAGWTAAPIDAGPQSAYLVVPVDIALRGIPLVPGHHHLRLDYAPFAFDFGKRITLASLVLWTVVILLWLRLRTQPAGNPLNVRSNKSSA